MCAEGTPFKVLGSSGNALHPIAVCKRADPHWVIAVSARDIRPVNRNRNRTIALINKRLFPMGFRYTGMFAATPRTRGKFIRWYGTRCLYIDSFSRNRNIIGVFKVTPKQKHLWLKDKATLVPPGHVAPSAGDRELIGENQFIQLHVGPITESRLLEVIKFATARHT